MPFADFPTLILNTTKGEDWELFVRQPGAPLAIITIHGGGIEPPTSQLAAAIAGAEHNLYDLRGLRATGNAELRVPAIRFQEMRLQMLLEGCQAALHLDGVDGDEAVLYLGGRNAGMVNYLEQALNAAGFRVESPPSPVLDPEPPTLLQSERVGRRPDRAFPWATPTHGSTAGQGV